jgi:hypothetical protein
MKIFRLAVIIVFLILAKNANANEIKFGWNIGNIILSYDVINNTPVFDAELLHFNWLYNKYSFGFNLLEYHNLENEERTNFSILPLNIAFVPFNFMNTLFFAIYCKIGLGLTQLNNENRINMGFYGSIGTKFYLFPALKFNYSPYLSVFTEYNTRNELRIGLGFDLSAIIYFALLAFKEDTERKYNTSFDWTKR